MHLAEDTHLLAGIEVTDHGVTIRRLRPLGLPYVVRSHGVLRAVEGVWESKWAAEGAVIVIGHPRTREDNQKEGKSGGAGEEQRSRAVFAKQQAITQDDGSRYAEEEAFVGTAQYQDRNSGCKPPAVGEAAVPDDTGE